MNNTIIIIRLLVS